MNTLRAAVGYRNLSKDGLWHGACVLILSVPILPAFIPSNLLTIWSGICYAISAAFNLTQNVFQQFCKKLKENVLNTLHPKVFVILV